MFKNQKPEEKNNITEEKISWYRRRWFWGMVLGVVFGLVYNYYLSLMSFIGIINKSHTSISDLAGQFLFFLLHLPDGINRVLLKGILYNKISFTAIYNYLLMIIYYLIILLLLYKTFKNKKVKIKYPVILILIISISLFGIVIGSIAS